jgi:hypothetical protein
VKARLIDIAVRLALAIALLAAIFLHAKAEPLAVVNPQGDELLRCRLPTSYLPDVQAIVCDVAPLFSDGFE